MTELSTSFHYKPNSAFSQSLPYLQLAMDSTSLGLLKECPRKYFYSIIMGYSSRTQSIHLTFGLLFHSALEQYDHKKFSGLSHDEALEFTVLYLLNATWDRELGKAKEMEHEAKTRANLLRTVVWYLDQFKDDPLETIRLDNGRPAIELSFRFDSGYASSTGEPFLLCGHLDKLASMDSRTYIVDRKTTSTTLSSSYFEKYTPDNQFSLYNFAGSVVYSTSISGIIVDAAQIAVTFSRFQRQTIFRPTSLVDEWYKDLGYYLSMAEMYAKREYWPCNDKSCGSFGGCPFRTVCSKPESLRPQYLNSMFTRRVWDPLISRGDI